MRRDAKVGNENGIHRDEVVAPILRHWKVFDRSFGTPAAQRAQAELAEHLDQLAELATRYEDKRAAATASR